jgi:hypothetical protein
MRITQLAAITLLAAAFGAHNASALTIDQSNGTTGSAAANFGDPDDKIPFPHVADDGSQPSGNFQMQPIGNSGASFGFSGSSNDNTSAFQRAQDRMQQ